MPSKKHRRGRLAAAVAIAAATLVGLVPTVAGAATSPVQPGNKPTALPGAVNGEVPRSDLIGVVPGCLAARAAGPSLARLFATAREQGVGLGPEECYRPLADQVAVRRQWAAAGNSACAAPVQTSPSGKPVGTSMHGWGKAVDFSQDGHGLTFGSSGSAFLRANAASLGWNHPGWAEPGGSVCPEPWHWEWVGDGGVLGASRLRGDVVGLLPSADGHGYATVTGLGAVAAHGSAVDRGDAATIPLSWVVVGAAPTPRAAGYWLVAADGGVFTFGDARFYGSTGGMRLTAPVVGMAPTRDARGYWLVAGDGGVFSFGDARFYGSTGGMRLVRPVVGMARAPEGGGYWLVASDGGVFSFGDAAFHGSTGGLRLDAPIVGMASTPDGGGYWLVAADGGVFSFGDAAFHGSGAAPPTSSPVVGIRATRSGRGYWLVSADGTVRAFGDAGWYGNG